LDRQKTSRAKWFQNDFSDAHSFAARRRTLFLAYGVMKDPKVAAKDQQAERFRFSGENGVWKHRWELQFDFNEAHSFMLQVVRSKP
jgi:hypothetical protein